MKRYLTKLVILVVSLWLPVQAIAVPLLAIKCSDSEMGAIHAHAGTAHEHHGVDAGDPQDSQDPTDTHGNGAHFCCHHFSAISSALTIERADPPGFVPAFVLVRNYRFFPEPAKRPPLTRLV